MEPIMNKAFTYSRLLVKLGLTLYLISLLMGTGTLQLTAVDSKPGFPGVLKWRSIGPHRGGRVVAVTGHPVRKEVFYFGGTGSGVWKTSDSGETWKNISDGFFKTSSVGAIAVAHDNPNVIYVGMGESCLRGNISHGDGVYKSKDGGKTWQHIGLEDTRHIARIRIDPLNSNIVYVAALGHAFGANNQRGIFRSMNGGKTWQKILFKGNQVGAVDLVMEPGNSHVLYASFWQVRRFPWGFNSGGSQSAIYKSTDAGDSWQDIGGNPGLPDGIKGRIGLTISEAKPERIWAIIEAKKSGIYRSDDSGDNWTLVSTDANLLQRPWYYSHIKAHPTDADTLFVMNVGFWKSNDAGKSFKRIRTPHSDNHDLWIDPNQPDRMIEANDGGATITLDGGKSWSSIYNQPTAQFYHVATDNRFPYRVYGAQQDNSTISVPSRSFRGAIREDQWYQVGGCESGYIAVHPETPDIVFAGCYGGSLSKYDHKLRRTWNISVWPENPMGWGAKDLKYRFQWTFPILFSSHDPKNLYVAGNHVFRSTTQGRSWEVISPDLTRNDKSKMESSGGPLTQDNTSVEYYGTIFALAESPIKKGLLWAGSDDGLIHISQNNGISWQNVTPKVLPQWSLISIIEPSRFDAGTLYVAATRYKLDDYQPYLFVTHDYGKTWNRIDKGIPRTDFTRVIREDPNKKGLLYAGTEAGIYFSADAGKNWQSLQFNLPVTPVHDMKIRNYDLVVATHGRSFWILDDLTLLHQNLELIAKKKELPPVFLYQPSVTVRANGWFIKEPVNAGQSLPIGVIVHYYLKEKTKKNQKVILTFLDEKGNKIRTYSQKPINKRDPKVTAKAGVNRFNWDFTYPGASKVKGAVFWGPGDVSPQAAPGKYKVMLSVGKDTFAQSFEIVKEPNLNISDDEYKQQFNFMVKIRDKLTQVHDAVNEIRSIRKQVKWVIDRTKKETYAKTLKELADVLEKKLSAIEDQLIQHKAKASQDLLNHPIRLNNKLAALGGWVVKSSIGTPTKQAMEVFNDLSKRADEQLNALQEIIKTDVVNFNNKVQDFSVPAIIPKHFKEKKKPAQELEE
jgi:photosystem II stability/assembly factor-like uncharacterized protein